MWAIGLFFALAIGCLVFFGVAFASQAMKGDMKDGRFALASILSFTGATLLSGWFLVDKMEIISKAHLATLLKIAGVID